MKIRLTAAFLVAPLAGATAFFIYILLSDVVGGYDLDRSIRVAALFMVGAILIGYAITLIFIVPLYLVMIWKWKHLELSWLLVIVTAFVVTFLVVFIYVWGVFDPHSYATNSSNQTIHVSKSIHHFLNGIKAGLFAGIWSVIGGHVFWLTIRKGY